MTEVLAQGFIAPGAASAKLLNNCAQKLSLKQLIAEGCVLLVDKEAGCTSHDVVARARRAFGTRKVGHAGTLDPFATGLLTLGIGPATRLLTHFVGLEKVYSATVRLGYSTVTDDCEGQTLEIAQPEQLQALDFAAVTAAVQRFTGTLQQVPTAVSAVKINGKRAYQLVREGVQVQLQPRTVTVSEFTVENPRRITSENGQAYDFDCRVAVSSGTYVRALARDLGRDLGVFGHLTGLRRQQVGPFTVSESCSFSALAQAAAAAKAGGNGAGDDGLGDDGLGDRRGGDSCAALKLRPLSAAAAAAAVHGAVVVSDETAVALRHGKQPFCAVPDRQLVAAVDTSGTLVALVQASGEKLRVVTGFPQAQKLL